MISAATFADVSELNTLVNSAYRGDSSRKGWTTEADYLDGIRSDEEGLTKMLQDPQIQVLKYTEDNKIIGCVSLQERPDSLYLGMLTVSPDLQGGGIGKKLLAAAEVEAKKKDKPKISMNVVSIRSELIAWYERHGYRATGETQPFPMNDPKFGLPKRFLEFIVMEKPLVV